MVRLRDEGKRQRILAGALSLVTEQGLEQVSIDAVARAADVATGTVYVYFANKEALLNALYLEVKEALAAAVFRPLGEDLPVRLAFEQLCAAFLRYMLEHAPEMAVLRALRQGALLEPETTVRATESAQALVALVERGQREHLLKRLPAPLLLAFLEGALTTTAPLLAELPPRPRAQRIQELTQLAWDAIKA